MISQQTNVFEHVPLDIERTQTLEEAFENFSENEFLDIMEVMDTFAMHAEEKLKLSKIYG